MIIKNLLHGKKLLVAILLLLLPLALPSLSLASYGEDSQPKRQILVNKLVFNPKNSQFVDNLSVDQHLFLPEQEVTFRIEVKNISNEDLTDIEVEDRLPTQLNFVTGPGELNKSTNVVKFKIDKLTPNQTKTFDIKAKVKGAKDIPANVFCITNLAEAKVGELVDQDTSNLCLQKQVLGVTTELPKTGLGSTNTIFLFSTLALGLSVYFFKKARV